MTSSAKPTQGAPNAPIHRGRRAAQRALYSAMLWFAIGARSAAASPLDDAPTHFDERIDANTDAWTEAAPLTREQALDLAAHIAPTLKTARSQTEEAILKRSANRID